MDWHMDDGLYSRFQTWKISCNLILDSELCELSEVRKVNTLLRWSGDFGIKKLKSWQKEPSQLTLDFIWDEYESYCKPQSNELRARYDVLKKLTQGSLPADDWMTKLQSQLHLCNYQPEMEEVLLRDLFLFGLQDESFMSTRSPEALCRAVIFYVLYFIYIFFSCYIFTKVQLLWLLHSSGPLL